MKIRRAGYLLASILVLGLCVDTSADLENRPSTSAMSAADREAPLAGCCSDADVLDFGTRFDFGAWPQGFEINDQLKEEGVLFGRAATPMAATTVVRIDYARTPGCRSVLNGDPVFQGWEYFVFADSTRGTWSTVQKVGASVGYCDNLNSCFIAAYDSNGDLLEARFNDRIGFQFLAIERPSSDISQVLIGDCVNVGTLCHADPAGSAINCLSYSAPQTSAVALPAMIVLPEPPLRVGTPMASPLGLLGLGLLLSGVAAWVVRRTGCDRSGGPLHSG